MKKMILLAFAISLLNIGFSQSQENYTKGKFIGLSGFINSFESADILRSQGITQMLQQTDFLMGNDIHFGLQANYMKGLAPHVDFIGTLGGASFKYPGVHPSQDKSLYLEGTGSVNFKLLTDKYAVVPYANVGVGVSEYRGTVMAFIPTGVGLQFKLSPNFFLLANSQYRIGVTEKAAYHFYHGLGFVTRVGKQKVAEQPLPAVPEVADRDGDGVPDDVDRCPDTPGLASLDGCPDRDGDGIADIDDKCPDEPGIAKYQGCPIPDSDGDGINDEEDKCPNVPGVARYQGCPVPDSDGDGVNDEEDKCPNEPGPASNQGCPVIEQEVIEKVNTAAKNVFFNSSSYQLLQKSYKPLNEVVQILKDNPSYNISIDGYTDNTGGVEMNQTLSENRAGAVKEYLIKNGISESRITSAGHGINDPIADNNTVAGRAQNRRVEMTLRNY